MTDEDRTSWHRGKYPPTLIRALVVQQLLFRLGFSPADEIVIEVKPHYIDIILIAQGKIGNIGLGKPELPLDQLTSLWKSLVADWNAGGAFSNEEKESIITSSNVWQRRFSFITNLVAQGFQIDGNKARLVKLN